MNPGIIDSVEELSKLSPDELTEKLLDPKYNKQNLRELVRRALFSRNEFKQAHAYQYAERERAEQKLEELEQKVAGF